MGPIIEALRACGLAVGLAEDSASHPSGSASPDCFATVSPNDLLNESGAKACGAALKLTGRAMLLQASIPYSEPEVEPSLVIRGGRLHPFAPWDHEAFPEALQKAISRFG
jgi:hypothetical protein